MSLEAILKSHTLKRLRQEVTDANMHYYSHLGKADLISWMIKPAYKGRFAHMKPNVKVSKAKPKAPKAVGGKKPRSLKQLAHDKVMKSDAFKAKAREAKDKRMIAKYGDVNPPRKAKKNAF